MANNYIYIGSTSAPSHFFDNESLLSVHADVATSMIEDELKIDTMEFEVSYDDTDETLRNLAYATPIYYYNGPNFMGTFYFKSVERYGDHYYRVEAVSVIGLLEYETYYGTMCVSKNVKDLVSEVIMTDGLQKKYVTADAFRTKTDRELVSVTPHVYSYANVYPNSLNQVFHMEFVVLKETPMHSVWDAEDRTRRCIYRMVKTYNDNGEYKDFEMSVYVSRSDFSAEEDLLIFARYGKNVRYGIDAMGACSCNTGDVIGLDINVYENTIQFTVNGTKGTLYQNDDPAQKPSDFPIGSIMGVYNNQQTGVNSSVNSEIKYELREFYVKTVGANEYTCNFIPLYSVIDNTFYAVDEIHKNVENRYGWTACNDFELSDNIAGGNSDEIISPFLYKIATNMIWRDGADQLRISGWVPVGSKRELFHKILFAMNLNLTKTADGQIIIGKLLDQVGGEIGIDSIYDHGSIQKVNEPTEIALTEYAYTPDLSAIVQLFDNSNETVGDGKYIVLFNSAPIYGIPTATSGMTIHEYNANAAVVSGRGRITANVYREGRRDIVKRIADRADGGRVSVSSVQLVTALNASSVMDKLIAYYGGDVYKIKNSIVANGERTGAKYSFLSPFGEQVEAFLNAYVLNNSSIAKIDCEFTSGFVPQDIGAQYNNFVILTGSGTWTVPESVFEKTNPRIYVVLIGGGQGGASGLAGADGNSSASFSTRSVAKGGMYGENGSSGKVFTQEINNPAASYTYSCGVGGSGGAICADTQTNNKGNNGTDTTFHTFSSASGVITVNGYTNLLNGEVYAANMPQWNADSGKGGDGEYVTVGSNRTYESIVRYAASTIYNFMTGKTLKSRATGLDRAWGLINASTPAPVGARSISQLGGGHGGAALDEYGNWHETIIDTAGNERDLIGGAGATPTYVPPKATTYNPHYFGYGGMGGPGGGGGGNGGAYEDRWSGSSAKIYGYVGGKGGSGGRGGDGGDGCVLIYY